MHTWSEMAWSGLLRIDTATDADPRKVTLRSTENRRSGFLARGTSLSGGRDWQLTDAESPGTMRRSRFLRCYQLDIAEGEASSELDLFARAWVLLLTVY